MEMEQQLRNEEWKEKCSMLAICDMTAAENEDKFTNYNWELRWELGQLSDCYSSHTRGGKLELEEKDILNNHHLLRH